MRYIIDGHNLIPHVRGLSLRDLDDEQALVEVLTPFLRATSSRAMVFLTGLRRGMKASATSAWSRRFSSLRRKALMRQSRITSTNLELPRATKPWSVLTTVFRQPDGRII